MKLVLDKCVWGGASSSLREKGHDVIWVGDWKQDPGDDEILEYAYREGRILVTLDKDFGEMAVVERRKNFGIIRLVDISARQQGPLCLRIITLHEKDLKNGALITAEPGRLRIRLSSP